ncbi:MAG: phosphate/phosphite/phosphonate ABC transporter substrate-binding protein [Candidatus Liptonbacteria bacterium]|nr:phosphate/phosphite/phosphonate ABC transporter substrate-binding protein [Candidatus Liptonbacteria bacterium]
MKKLIIIAVLVLLAGGVWWFVSMQNKVVPAVQPVAEDQRIVLSIAEPIGGNTVDSPIFQASGKEYNPFIKYVASKLTSYGVKDGNFVAVQNPYEASVLMRQGKLDIYVDSPFPAYVVAKLAGSEPLVNRWKREQELYHSNIFVKKDSKIKTLDDLKGKMMVFQKPDSTSAYFLPKAELIKRGYTFTKKTGPGDKVLPNEIGYYFASGDVESFHDVFTGKAAASAQNDADFKTIASTTASQYRFIFSTVDVFRHVIVIRANLDPKLKNAIKQILLDMDKTPEGLKILSDFKKTTKFSEFLPNAETAFKGISELTALIEKEIIGQ